MSLLFKPVSGSHAIDTCTVTVRFAQAVDAQTFAAISHIAKMIADSNDLPANQQVVFPQMFMPPGFQQGNLTGTIFQRFAKNGTVETELRCEPGAITLQVRSYAGWPSLKAFIDRTMLQIVPLYISSLPAISSVQIQYDNKFISINSEAPAAGEIFNHDTKWVAIYDPLTVQPWHSHFGIFISQSANKRELINVNVSVNDQASAELAMQRIVNLTILVGQNFDVFDQPPLITSEQDASNAINSLLEQSHNRQKQILQEVLSGPYLHAVGAEVN